MSLELMKEKGIQLDDQKFDWRDIVRLPTSKLDDDALTRVRIILMNGIESEALRFQHACARMNKELQLALARVRRVEQHAVVGGCDGRPLVRDRRAACGADADAAPHVHGWRAVDAEGFGDGATAGCRRVRRQHDPHPEFLSARPLKIDDRGHSVGEGAGTHVLAGG